MAFLKINGLTVPIENASANKGFSVKGSRAQSISGGIIDRRIGWRKTYSFVTSPIPLDEALALECLIYGRGHDFTFSRGFDSLTGLTVDVGSRGLTLTGAGWPAYGAAFFLSPYLQKTFAVVQYGTEDSSSNPVDFSLLSSIDAQFDDDNWTAIWWEYSNLNWHRMGRTSDGRGYRDGVRNDEVGIIGSTVAPVSVLGVESSRGVFKVRTNRETASLPDAGVSWLQLMPCRPTNDQMLTLTERLLGSDELPYERPFVSVEGDALDMVGIFGSAKVACIGEVTQLTYLSMYVSDEFVNNATRLAFDLVEFEEAYKDF